MAKFKKGFLKAFSGAVGGIEGYELNGQLVIRSRRSKPAKPPSQKQMDCRERMKTISAVLGCFTEVIKMGFAEAAAGKLFNAYSAAVAYNLQNAVAGNYPDVHLDYSKLRITQGPIPTDALLPSISLQGQRLAFTWPTASSHLHNSGRAILIAYAPALRKVVYNLCGNLRRSGTDSLILPYDWQNREIQAYLSFRNEAGNSCGNSVYSGMLM